MCAQMARFFLQKQAHRRGLHLGGGEAGGENLAVGQRHPLHDLPCFGKPSEALAGEQRLEGNLGGLTAAAVPAQAVGHNGVKAAAPQGAGLGAVLVVGAIAHGGVNAK